MSLPYHRGHPNSAEMNQRGGNHWGTREQRVEEGNRTIMEQENDRKWDELGDQVAMLKTLTMDINQEVLSQNKMLDGMICFTVIAIIMILTVFWPHLSPQGLTFGTAGDLFRNTIGKLGSMLTQSSSYHMYYLVAFIVFIFLVLYFLMGRK